MEKSKSNVIIYTIGLISIVSLFISINTSIKMSHVADYINENISKVSGQESIQDDIKSQVISKPLTAVAGMEVFIEYTGKLADGSTFDSSVGKAPLGFIVGAGRVIVGMDKGVIGMKQGDTKTIVIAPEEAYGEAGIPGVIPVNSTLTFDIKMIKVIDTKTIVNNNVGVIDINIKELQTIINDGEVIVIDIRRKDEWIETGFIEGSKTLTLYNESGSQNPDFMKSFSKLVPTKDTPFALICRTGSRTGVATEALNKRLGYTNVYNVKGGITSWIASGLPVAKY